MLLTSNYWSLTETFGITGYTCRLGCSSSTQCRVQRFIRTSITEVIITTVQVTTRYRMTKPTSCDLISCPVLVLLHSFATSFFVNKEFLLE